MASSDSEDFASADEEISENPKPVPNVKHNTNFNVKKDEQDSDELKNDGAGLDCLNEKPEGKPAKCIVEEPKETKPTLNERNISSGRRQRQQRQREPKSNSKPKKLGIKITSEVKTVEQDNALNNDFVNMQEKIQIDGEAASFKSDMIKLTEKADKELDTYMEENSSACKQATSSRDVDPYAKFKGYSMPPERVQCWEEGVDNYALYGIDPKPEEKVTNCEEKTVAPVLDKLCEVAAEKQADSSWGGWGSWGVTSLLSTATESVSTLTSHVSSVLESGIGAPKPEELAQINQMEQQKYESESATIDQVPPSEQEPTGLFNFGQLMTSMSSISKLVESTGSKVISGGLDTLETIGKKTMEVLQEGDPGFKKKRAMFSDNTVLSQVLREAKEQAEVQDKIAENQQELRNIHFETLFDEYQGLVHLEALEMLSKQCDLKLQTLLLSITGAPLVNLQENLQKIKESCHLPDDEDVNDEESEPHNWWNELTDAEQLLGIPVTIDKFTKIWNETQEWIKESLKSVELEEGAGDMDMCNARDIHKKAVSTLAQLTAMAMEQFHKGAELLLVKEKRDSIEEAKALKQVTSVLCSQVTSTATNFCERLNSCIEESPSDSINALITNVFLEASNSSSYIQEAFQLLIPVLQVGITS